MAYRNNFLTRRRETCSYPDMSAAPTATDPTPPGRSAYLLALLHQLIAYGKELADTLRQNGAAALTTHTWRFGTSDIALILARITRGLQLATALQARISTSAAALDAPPKPARTARAPRQATRRPTPPKSPLADLPTAEEIAAAVRGRPIGAVIADICRDLGIFPAHPLWRALQSAIIRYSGNFARFVSDMLDRALPLSAQVLAGTAPPPVFIAPAGTGPP